MMRRDEIQQDEALDAFTDDAEAAIEQGWTFLARVFPPPAGESLPVCLRFHASTDPPVAVSLFVASAYQDGRLLGYPPGAAIPTPGGQVALVPVNPFVGVA